MAHETETNKNFPQNQKRSTQAEVADEGQMKKNSFKNKTLIKDPKIADDVDEYEMSEEEDVSENNRDDKSPDRQTDEQDNPYTDLEMDEDSDTTPYNDFRH